MSGLERQGSRRGTGCGRRGSAALSPRAWERQARCFVVNIHSSKDGCGIASSLTSKANRRYSHCRQGRNPSPRRPTLRKAVWTKPKKALRHARRTGEQLPGSTKLQPAEEDHRGGVIVRNIKMCWVHPCQKESRRVLAHLRAERAGSIHSIPYELVVEARGQEWP